MNQQKLEARMQQCRISKKEAQQRLGLSRSAFYRKCNGKSEFTLAEIRILMDLLELESADGEDDSPDAPSRLDYSLLWDLLD